MDRPTARRNGALFYQGFSCRFGHPGIRYTSTGNCRDCLKSKPTGPMITRSYTGLPQDIELLDQFWRSIVDSRKARLQATPLGATEATPGRVSHETQPEVDPSMLPPKLVG